MPSPVDKYFKQVKDSNPSYSDEQAWATAWSIYCKYKNPDSSSCHQDDYLTKKTADAWKVDAALPRVPRYASDAFVYGTKIRHGSIFLTAFNLNAEEGEAFMPILEREVRKSTHSTYWPRLTEDEKGVWLVWWEHTRSSRERAYQGMGDDDDFDYEEVYGQLASLEAGIESAARHAGYHNIKRVPHAADVRAKTAAKTAGFSYRSLEDAAEATGNPAYGQPGAKIWYFRRGMGRDFMMGYKWLSERSPDLLDPQNLRKTHVLLGEVGERDLESIFDMMQGERWSPKGEARSMLSSLGLDHTSMSVGDVVQIGSTFHMVDGSGFERIASAMAQVNEYAEYGLEDACWEDYEAYGFKDLDGKRVPNCVPKK